MNVKYLGTHTSNCEVCGKYVGKHSYEYELLLPNLYSKKHKTKMIVCENCARREVGSKHWATVKREKKIGSL